MDQSNDNEGLVIDKPMDHWVFSSQHFFYDAAENKLYEVSWGRYAVQSGPWSVWNFETEQDWVNYREGLVIDKPMDHWVFSSRHFFYDAAENRLYRDHRCSYADQLGPLSVWNFESEQDWLDAFYYRPEPSYPGYKEGLSEGCTTTRPPGWGKKNQRKPRSGIVYLIHAEGTAFYKVGITTRSLESRMKELQTGSPHPLILASSFLSPDIVKDEAELHTIFAEHRRQGEWFELPADFLEKVYEIEKGKASQGEVE